MSEFELTELQAQVVELRDGHGLTFQEIGRRLGGKNQGNVHRIYSGGKRKLAKASNFPTRRQQVQARLAAFQDQHNGEPVTNKTLVDGIAALISLIMFVLQDDKAALIETRPKDLVMMVEKLIEKWQLLQGEPTAIMKYQDIRKLDEVAKALHDEMVRRGMVPGPVIDVTPEESGEQRRAADQ